MVSNWPPIRLSELPTHMKILVTCFIAVLGLGFLTGYVFIYVHFEMADGVPGMTINDVACYFKDGKGPSRLERAVSGRMSMYFTDEKERKKVLDWARKPDKPLTKEREYPEIRDILDQNCLYCHGRGQGMKFPPLETFKDVELASVPEKRPMTIRELTSTTHTHLMAISALVTAVSLLFFFTGVSGRLGALIVVTAYVGLLADIAGWWLATRMTAGAYVSAAGGSVMGTMLCIMLIWSFLATWFGGKKFNKAE